jgi:hypothetical protein
MKMISAGHVDGPNRICCTHNYNLRISLKNFILKAILISRSGCTASKTMFFKKDNGNENFYWLFQSYLTTKL